MVWLQQQLVNDENGKEKWAQMTTWLNTPPAQQGAPRPAAVTRSSVPVLPPSQHAAAFAAFAGHGG